MLSVQLSGVRIAGVAVAVPEMVETIDDLARQFPNDDVAKIADSLGVETRHVDPRLCTSDLCYAASKRLLPALNWEPTSIGLICFVSQSADFLAPATACILQHRLGLSKSTAAFDMELGCSGFVYGFWNVASLMSAGRIKRALLLCGDVARTISPEDRAMMPLVGEAGAAVALELDDSATPLHFTLGSDGSGWKHLIAPAGGARIPITQDTTILRLCPDGNRRGLHHSHMNGPEIFVFTLREVPGMVHQTLQLAGWNMEQVDYVVFHQANAFMLKHLAAKLKIPGEKMVLGLRKFGNTSSASVPLAMVSELRERLTTSPTNLLMAGFGIGFSWGGIAMATTPMIIPDLVYAGTESIHEEKFA